MKQNRINHIGLVLDASDSMRDHASEVVKVTDTLIQQLAYQSQLMDQETRVTLYTFNYLRDIQCLVYDKDVLRLPSISGLYRTSGMTALCSATRLSIEDLKLTPEKYGEHSFLIYVVTDGLENDSRPVDRAALPSLITGLPDHWTLAAFVPDASSKHYAKQFGFPADNIAVWDASSASGFTEVGEIITRSANDFMENRAKGVRGSKSLFTLNTVKPEDIRKTLTPVTQGSYILQDVPEKIGIEEVPGYVFGRVYYEMTTRVLIQEYKKIAILTDGKLYTGQGARALIGLPEKGDVKVSPGDHQGYKIFVQSTAPNRKLLAGTQCLIMR